jgi:Cysteine-rich secretory protein family
VDLKRWALALLGVAGTWGCQAQDAVLISALPGEGGGGILPVNCNGVELQTDESRFPAELAQQFLDMHNARRTQYCLTPMSWDCDLATIAQAYAELGAGDLPHNDQRDAQYATLTGCSSDCPQLGENIYWHSPWDFFPFTDAPQAWLDEEDAATCNLGGLHYTQIVWESATRLGCGAFIDASGKYHVVCNYVDFQTGGDAFPVANCTSCN